MDRRIYGLETEYALFLNPESAHARCPTRREIFEVLEEVVGRRYRTMRSRIAKKGLFLENGGLLHYEAQIDQFAHGMVEISTPECVDPLQATCWHEACQRVLQDSMPELRARLRERGFRGSVSFGKNTTDGKGNYYGSHENYLVDDPPGFLRGAALRVLSGIFFVFYALLMVVVFLPALVVLLGFFIGIAFYFLFAVLQFIPLLGRLFQRGVAGLDWVAHKASGIPEDAIVRWWGRYHKYTVYPFVELYSILLSPLVFPVIRRYLTPFLVSRQIFTGSGRVDFSSGLRGSHLSQKVEAIHCLCRIFWDDKRRPIYDIKNFIRPPFGLLERKKRLHLLMSDSNMSEYATYLKLGVTGLVLEMIEAGVRFDDVLLQDPISALREVSRDPSLRTRVPLRNGNAMTPLEMQRRYLEEAKLFYSGKADVDPITRDLLRRWEYVLDTLQDNPHFLYKELDWVAKKDLVEEALRDGPGWEVLARLGPLIDCIDPYFPEIPSVDKGEDGLRQLLQARLPSGTFAAVRTELARQEASFTDLARAYETYYRVQKIDLKYHDLDPQEGYFFRLRTDGLVTRVLDDAAVAAAITQPPRETRAHIRGHVIKRFHDPSYQGSIDWVQARIEGPERRRYRFPDPFDPGRPEELPPLPTEGAEEGTR